MKKILIIIAVLSILFTNYPQNIQFERSTHMASSPYAVSSANKWKKSLGTPAITIKTPSNTTNNTTKNTTTTKKTTANTKTTPKATTTYTAPTSYTAPTVVTPVKPVVQETTRPSWIPTGDAGYSSTGGGNNNRSSLSSDSLISDLKKAQLAASEASLQKARDAALSNVEGQYSSIDTNAYAARNAAAAQNDIGALNFAQRAAARGVQGNQASMPEIYRNSALQGQIGAIDSSVLANKNALDTQKTNIANSYESDLVAAQAGIEANALQAAIDQANQNKQNEIAVAGLTGTYDGTTTLAGQSQALANARAQLEIDAATIANSYLPQSYKDQAAQLKQQVEAGRIDIATAQAQLDRIKRGLKTL